MKIKERITICYFSATGNSLKAAMDIAAEYTAPELVKIGYKTASVHPESDIVGFIFPVYMGGIPGIVEQFLLDYPFRKQVYYFAVATYYTYQGVALSTVNKIFTDRGITLNYTNYLPTVGNCLMEYEVSERKRPAILKRAETVTKLIVDDITNKKENTSSTCCYLSVKFHKLMFHLIFGKVYKKFSLEAGCCGCAVCAKVCPVGTIHFQGNKPRWDKSCIACHACVHWCPRNAIKIGRSKGRLPYHHPEIKARMLFR